MSFGFSLGDFLAIFNLANDLRGRFAQAPKEYKSINDEVECILTVLHRIDGFDESKFNQSQTEDMKKVTKGCRNVLQDLEAHLNKFRVLANDSTPGWKTQVRQAWKRVQWDQSKIDGLRSRIVSSISLFNLVVGKVDQDLAVKIEHGVRTLIERQDDQERESILSWLSPLSPSARQSEVFNSHQRGTGTWLFGTAEFQRWIAGDEKTLFCPGIPGAGKTVLASIIIDHLERTFADREDVGITYFFCDYRQQQTLVGLYSALLKQLVQGQVSIPDRVVSMWKTHSNKGTSPSEEEVYSQLRSVITKCRRGLIVLDALDECPVHNGMQSVRTIFLRKIMRLCEEDGIGILATSRPDKEISAFFKIGPFVEIQASTDDIESYVEARIDELHSFAHEKPGLKQCIKDDITRAASGKFLLARLYFNLLMDQSSEKRIQGMLQKFRTGSQSTAYQYAYNETVKRIESQSSEKLELAKATIGWIMSAKRPFTVKELEFAIAIEAGSSCPDIRNITSIKQLIPVCCGLVVVDETTDHVKLVHYTTQKYFESIGDTWLFQMKVHLTKSCLTYISYEAFEAQPWHLGGGFALLDIPLYEYMFRNWGLHYKEHPTDQTLALQFLENEAKTAHSPYHDFHPHKSGVLMASCAGTIRGEHVAAFFGLADLLEDLLNIGTDYIEDRAYNSYTPLFFAALNGHEAVAQLLLDRGAKIEVSIQVSIQHYNFCGAPTDSYASPLFEAAAQGHDVIVRLFLDAGAENNGGDETLDSPLIRAIFGGHESTIRLLLEEGANTEQKLGRSSLHAAIDVQNERIVKLLLSRGADTEFTGADDMSALQLASIYTNEAIFRLLLDAGAKVDVADKYGNTLLHEAVLATDINVIRLLLDKGASPQIKNWRGRSSLHAAVTTPSATVVKLLLDRGAEVNSATKYGDTPLHIAALYGHWPVAQVLLDNGAILEPVNRKGATPLHIAVHENNAAMVRFLLDRGAAVNCQSSSHSTPLSLATFTGNKTIFELLLKHGADVHLPNRGTLPLPEAVSTKAPKNHHDIIRGSLSTSCCACEFFGHSLMNVAIATEDKSIMELVYAAGANLDVPNIFGRTPLFNAVCSRDAKLIKFLLTLPGADVDTKHADVWGLTPVIEARRRGFHEIEAMMMDMTERNKPLAPEKPKIKPLLKVSCHICSGSIPLGDVYFDCNDLVICNFCPPAQTMSCPVCGHLLKQKRRHKRAFLVPSPPSPSP